MLSSTEIILRLCVAAVLGAIVGLERERMEWAAGLRTHMLVCLGACLLMIVSAFGFADILGTDHVVLDPSRIAAQVVSGIGFLGAGTILFLRQEVIRGLTTAASLWTIAAVGLAVGGGLYLAAICSTTLIVVILAIIKPVEKRLFRRVRGRKLILHLQRGQTTLSQLTAALQDLGSIKEMTVSRREDPSEDRIQITFMRRIDEAQIAPIFDTLRAMPGVTEVSI